MEERDFLRMVGAGIHETGKGGDTRRYDNDDET